MKRAEAIRILVNDFTNQCIACEWAISDVDKEICKALKIGIPQYEHCEICGKRHQYRITETIQYKGQLIKVETLKSPCLDELALLATGAINRIVVAEPSQELIGEMVKKAYG